MTKKLKTYAGRDLDELVTSLPSLADVLKRVGKALDDLEAAGDPDAKFRRFFHDFNLHTNAAILKAKPRPEQLDLELLKAVAKTDDASTAIDAIVKAIDGIKTELRRRIGDRTGAFPNVPAFPKLDDSVVGFPKWIGLLSRLQRKLCAKRRSSIGKEEFSSAFERFASGELSFQLENLVVVCQPSSGFYFYFGEFALLALDNDSALKHWTKSAPSVLYTQRVFAQRYAPTTPVGKRKLESYSPATISDSKVSAADHAEWKRWRDEYEQAPVNDDGAAEGLTTKAGKNAHDYLRGEHIPAAPA